MVDRIVKPEYNRTTRELCNNSGIWGAWGISIGKKKKTRIKARKNPGIIPISVSRVTRNTTPGRFPPTAIMTPISFLFKRIFMVVEKMMVTMQSIKERSTDIFNKMDEFFSGVFRIIFWIKLLKIKK